MFKELIDRLRVNKQQLLNSNVTNILTKNKSIEIPIAFDINISKEDSIYRLEISDYISIVDYVEKMKLIDKFGMLDLISNSVLWNSVKQRVNKGIYYVISINNHLYNILINGETLKIDERIKNNDIIEEKIITFNTNNNEYKYCSFKHDKTGNTFYTKYYDKNRPFNLGALDLSEEETFSGISSIVFYLDSIEEITSIFDIELLKKYVLNDLCKNSPQRKKVL